MRNVSFWKVQRQSWMLTPLFAAPFFFESEYTLCTLRATETDYELILAVTNSLYQLLLTFSDIVIKKDVIARM
jgi:glutathionylspermidine synthase